MHNHPPFVLALEPDLRQAAVLKRVLRDRVHAEVMVVDSRDAAIGATSSRIPDVILLTALLSPRDEQELITHLRGLSGAEHVQTHTIPQLASSSHDSDGGQESGGLFGKLRRKKSADPIPGCDPNAFADEVGTFILRAAELRERAALTPPPVIDTPKRVEAGEYGHETATTDATDASGEEPVADVESAWSSPFEWRRPDPTAQKNSKKKEAPRKPLVRNAPLAVVAEEEEARREKEETERRAQGDAQRLEAEQRAREEADQRAREEAQREHERLEAERRAKEDAERRAKEAAERRAKEEAERRAKEEAERRAKEEAATRERERLEAERRAKEEADRRAKEEAARRAKEEAERRAREEAERRAKEEAERRAKEEAARRERERLEAERRAKEEAERRAKEEAEQRAKEEAERRAKEDAERLRAEAEERARREAETEDVEFEIDLDRDPFSDFRDDGDGRGGALLKLMPVTTWARTADSKRQQSADSARTDDVHQLMAGLSIPPHVAAVAYPRGCRIRRVRVPAPRPAPRSRMTRPVILSKRALADARNDQSSEV